MTFHTSVRTGSYWSDEIGQPRRRGVRIGRGRSYTWFPDEDVLTVATQLADYLEQNNKQIAYTTSSDHDQEEN
ncbi:hypothetical protein ABZ546_01505 [Brachybacterium paraconglomeratum]